MSNKGNLKDITSANLITSRSVLNSETGLVILGGKVDTLRS